mgnify:CR=1 FL=1
MDIIIRKFTVKRESGFEQVYPFTTFDCIFDDVKEEPIRQLFSYMREVFVQGIPATAGDKSVSGSSIIMSRPARCESDLIQFAKDSTCTGRGKFQHEVIEEYLIDNDPSCLATEVPVYDETYLGHIDILRFRDGRIEVVDYKPNAAKEKKAASQIARYKQLLCARTHIPHELVDAIYFDDKNCYSLI